MIQINGNLLDASLVRSGDRLTLGMTGDQPIDELLAMLNPEIAPEIRVLDDEGGTAAIYRGHALTAVTIMPGEPRANHRDLAGAAHRAERRGQAARGSGTAENHRRGARGGALWRWPTWRRRAGRSARRARAALIELAEMMTADNNGGEGTDNGGDLSAADQSGKTDA